MNYTNKKYLLTFFSVTFLWTWICGFLPVILGITGSTLGSFIFYFGGGAPSVVALFLVFFTYPKAARHDYFCRCFSFKKMGWRWPILIFALFTLVAAVSLYIGVYILGYEIPGMDFISIIEKQPYMVFIIFILSLISGPLNEEFGWRGYALDKLFVRFGFTGASLILGFIWAIWHLPWYFTPGQAQYNMLQNSFFNAFFFIPSCILFSVVVSFVYIKTGRSILAGAFVHMISNLLTSQLIAPYTAEMGLVIRYTSIVFYIAILIYVLKSKKFKIEFQREIGAIKTDEKQYLSLPKI